MKIDQNPFSIYDFLGYLIPGIIFAFGVVFCIQTNFYQKPFISLDNLKIDQYIIILFLCYLVGHLLSYLSSISIEFFSIWSLGYPSRYLMGYPIPGFWLKLFNKNNKKRVVLIAKLFICLYILPVIATDFIIRKFLRTTSILGKSIDKASKKRKR